MSTKSKKKYLVLTDPESSFLFREKEPFEIVTNLQEYNSIEDRFSDFDSIIILAELVWEGKIVADFQGFDLAVELRRKKKLLAPIVIISTFPQYVFEFLAEKELKYQILFGRGTKFIEVTAIDSELESSLDSVEPIGEAVLADMNEMLLDLSGMLIDRLTHDLSPGLTTQRFEECMDDIAGYLSQTQLSELDWVETTDSLRLVLNNNEEFNSLKDRFLLKCDQVLKPSRNLFSVESDRRHKVLFLEDDPVFINQIKENLEDHFDQILITSSSEEALRLIDEDEGNSIVGVVTDWRLYADSKKKYWQRQGYEVLQIASQKRFISLFALTSLSDRNVHNIRNMLGVDIHLFKKNHLDQSSGSSYWLLIADTIRQECDRVTDLIASQPSGKAWGSLKYEYLVSRQKGWRIFESDISVEASKLFVYYNASIMEGNPRNVYSFGEMGLSLKNNLKNVLILRRVFFGLYFKMVKRNEYLQHISPSLLGEGEQFDSELKHHALDTHSLLKKDWWDDTLTGVDSTEEENQWKKFEQRVKNLRSALCVEIAALPHKGILPEEKMWLRREEVDFSFLFNYWTDDKTEL